MNHKELETVYYVSHLNSGVVSIINGNDFSIIKELEIGSRPTDICVDEKNNIYIANDRTGEITIINNIYVYKKTWYMPNNGHIQVDPIKQKIYVCNTDEVCIYSLITGEKINSIDGFIAAGCLRLDKNKQRLFVLDILQNEITIYSTLDLKLVKKYSRIGKGANCIALAEDEKAVYIANKGVYRGYQKGNISILDLTNGNITYIDLPKGSYVTGLEKNENFLYLANKGLHRIEVIDVLKKESIAEIKTTFSEIERIKLSPDKRKLLVTNRNSDGESALDVIDTSNNIILDKFLFKNKNTFPCDIGILIQKKSSNGDNALVLTNQQEESSEKDQISILAKKVISTYQEKIIFSEVLIELPNKMQEKPIIDDIKFQQCKIIEDTKKRTILDSRKDYSTLKYDFYIAYYLNLKYENEDNYIVEGKLVGSQKATLYIPTYIEQQGIQYVINSFTNLTSNPEIINGKIKFAVSILISTKVVVEEVISIPSCINCQWWKRRNEREEGTL